MKNTYKPLITLAVTAFIGSGTIVAAAEKVEKEKMPAPGAVEKEASKPASMFPLAEDVTASDLEKLKDEYLEEKGWNEGFNRKANGEPFYIGWQTADINLLKNDIRYGQARMTAFERAYSDAKGEFARYSERQNTTRTVRELFNVDEDLLPDPKELNNTRSRMQLIWDRILTLTEAKLDKQLEKMGIDPSEFQGKSKSIRQKMLRDSITRTIKTEAISSVAGLRVLHTVEDDETVGVLVIYSSKMKQVAQSIASGHTVGISAKRDPKESILRQIKAQTGLKPENLYMIHGLRVMTDDNGDRALVAFGQWSPQVTVNQSKLKQNIKIKTARGNALDLASGLITDFVNSTVVLNQESTFEAGSEIGDMITGEITEEYEEIKVGSKLDKVIEETGRSTLKGEVSVHTWSGNHPESGHLLVGKILMWSPASAQAMIDPGPRDPKNPGGSGDAPNEGGRGKPRSSPRLGDDDDF